MGMLTICDISSGRTAPIDDLLYCKFCFDEQKADGKGHMSKIYCSKKTTATGNHLQHAVKHGKEFNITDQPQPKLTAWMKRVSDNSPAVTQYEFNRDIAQYLCRDLVPFRSVEKPGFKAFCTKNTPFTTPSADTVGTTALVDLYSLVKSKVCDILSTCYSGTLMMDGWTDKYKANPYFAIRVSVIINWQFKVITLSIQPVESHTSKSLLKVVRQVIAEFIPHNRGFLFFNTTDGASNMKLLSKLLGHERLDCTAHCLHLLITVDGVEKVPDLMVLLRKCKDIVSTLHFKGYVVTDAKDIVNDMAMFDRIERVLKVLSADDENPVVDDPDDGRDSDFCIEHPARDKTEERIGHQSLKNSVCTRWNSTLTMIESFIDLRLPMTEALKKLGKFDMCLDEEEFSVLEELKLFLDNFKSMTLLVSGCNPNLTLLPLLRTRIIKACEARRDTNQCSIDSSVISSLKKHVRGSVDKRIKVNDLVKLTSCFDPGVRNAVLTNDECRSLLQCAFDKLTADGSSDEYTSPSPVRHVFVNNDVANLTQQHEDPSDRSSEAKKLRLSLLQDTYNVSTSTRGVSTIGDPFAVEVNRYLSMNTSQDSTALEFWATHEADFPLLSKMARIYLAVSPGSVPVECLFSTTGLLLNSKRSSLAPYKMNMITFNHDNYEYMCAL